MSWMLRLYETYENNKNIAGVMSNTKSQSLLLPVGHITYKAHIEITIDEEGNFKWAEVIDENDASTIVPSTESSAGRASGVAPHPLCDKLQYVAQDYEKYGGKKKPYYEYYNDLLGGWCKSEFSHWKAKAVLTYVEKGTVIQDLINHGVLHVGPDEKLIEKWDSKSKEDKPPIFKVLPSNSTQADSVVRWSVEKTGHTESAVWKDKTLFDSWADYYNSLFEDKSFCYATGNMMPFSTNHPKYIRYGGDGAKLISSNDTSNYTFRGRFETANQACTIGYEVTQKAHNALKWLIPKQGYRNDTQIILAWAVSGTDIPSPTDDSFDLCGLDEADGIQSDEENGITYTAEQFAYKLNQRIAGYSAHLGSTESIVVMGLDSATPGRLSIILYRELTGSDFLNRINDWHNTCYWVHYYRKIADESNPKKKKNVVFFGAPAPKDIVEAAYGTNVSDSLAKSTIERLLPCIIDGRAIPMDIVESAVRRASNRVSMERWEFNKTLSIACALYKKIKEKEEYKVALDTKRTSRDYLYGRLLALADNLEKWALKDSGEKRLTNAERLMHRFANHPFNTWKTIELSLAPYKARLGGRSVKYDKIQQEVMDLFNTEDFLSDKKLSGEFLLGYHCQSSALFKKDESSKSQNEQDESN